MHKPIKYAEKGLSIAANGAWAVFNALNKINQRPSFTPKWSDKPLLKSYEKTKPPLGWPRETDSLCPTCVREARQEILDGKKDVSVLLNEKVDEIKATILERDGKILMVKDCPKHGHFEDVMSIDPAFYKHLEESFPGRDIRAHDDAALHNHGSSTILHGRGSVLTVDLTNRCNMMCGPCFMDANQVGYVHELAFDDVKQILDDEPDMVVVDECSNGSELLAKIGALECNLILLDISMPGRNGLEILEQLHNEKPTLPVLILSMYPEEQYAFRALRAGASGYITKLEPSKAVLTAIRQVLDGRVYLSEPMQQRLARLQVGGLGQLGQAGQLVGVGDLHPALGYGEPFG